MKHIKIQVTPGQLKLLKNLNLPEIKVTTKEDMVYFPENMKDNIANLIMEDKGRGHKTLSDKIKKL